MVKFDKQYSEEKSSEVIREYLQKSSERGTLDAHCTEIAERFLPAHSPLFQSQGAPLAQGEKRTEQLFDSAGMVALGRFASILYSLLTPRSQTWHRLQASDSSLNKNRQVRLWFEEVNRILFHHRYSPRANFS